MSSSADAVWSVFLGGVLFGAAAATSVVVAYHIVQSEKPDKRLPPKKKVRR
jgi:hypothetical protein